MININFYYKNNLLNVKKIFELELKFIKEKEEDYLFHRYILVSDFRELNYIFSNVYYYIEKIFDNLDLFYLYNNNNTLLFCDELYPFKRVFILEIVSSI